MTEIKRWYAENTNPEKLPGAPADVIEGCDLFVGVSGPGMIPAEALEKMADDAIVFAMANPTPEVMPEEAEPYVRIMATGRSDYPNQINNVLCFPGIFRGALDAGAPRITEEMKLAAAQGIADVVHDDDLAEDYIIPSSSTATSPPRSPRRWSRRRAARGSPASPRRPEPSPRSNDEPEPQVRQRCASSSPAPAGLSGSAVCDALLARGDEVVGLTRDPARARDNPTVNWHGWNPATERPPASALEGVDGVVNLLGEPINQRWTDDAKRRIRSAAIAPPAT